jgi:hypothetical protein
VRSEPSCWVVLMAGGNFCNLGIPAAFFGLPGCLVGLRCINRSVACAVHSTAPPAVSWYSSTGCYLRLVYAIVIIIAQQSVLTDHDKCNDRNLKFCSCQRSFVMVYKGIQILTACVWSLTALHTLPSTQVYWHHACVTFCLFCMLLQQHTSHEQWRCKLKIPSLNTIPSLLGGAVSWLFYFMWPARSTDTRPCIVLDFNVWSYHVSGLWCLLLMFV